MPVVGAASVQPGSRQMPVVLHASRLRVGLGIALALGAVSLTPPATALPVPTECVPGSAVVSTDNVLTFDNRTQCYWVVPAGVTAADVLVVGGGGSGGVDQFHGPG